MAAKTGVDAHDEDEVDVVDQPIEHLQRFSGVEHHTRLATRGLDGLNAAVSMSGGVWVKADQVGTGLGKQSRQCVDRLHHEVHIDGHGHTRSGFGVGL